jgi:hypothetical protein
MAKTKTTINATINNTTQEANVTMGTTNIIANTNLTTNHNKEDNTMVKETIQKLINIANQYDWYTDYIENYSQSIAAEEANREKVVKFIETASKLGIGVTKGDFHTYLRPNNGYDKTEEKVQKLVDDKLEEANMMTCIKSIINQKVDTMYCVVEIPHDPLDQDFVLYVGTKESCNEYVENNPQDEDCFISIELVDENTRDMVEKHLKFQQGLLEQYGKNIYETRTQEDNTMPAKTKSTKNQNKTKNDYTLNGILGEKTFNDFKRVLKNLLGINCNKKTFKQLEAEAYEVIHNYDPHWYVLVQDYGVYCKVDSKDEGYSLKDTLQKKFNTNVVTWTPAQFGLKGDHLLFIENLTLITKDKMINTITANIAKANAAASVNTEEQKAEIDKAKINNKSKEDVVMDKTTIKDPNIVTTTEVATELLKKIILQADTNDAHNIISHWMVTSFIAEKLTGKPLKGKDANNKWVEFSFTDEEKKAIAEARELFVKKMKFTSIKNKKGDITCYRIPIKSLVYGRHVWLGKACVFHFMSQGKVAAVYHVSLNGIKNTASGKVTPLDDNTYNTLASKCVFIC